MRVAPVTALSSKETEDQIAELYSTLLSYRPLAFGGPIHWNDKLFDGTLHALKTVASLILRSSGCLEALNVVYSDNTLSGKYGGNGGTERIFTLSQGECF